VPQGGGFLEPDPAWLPSILVDLENGILELFDYEAVVISNGHEVDAAYCCSGLAYVDAPSSEIGDPGVWRGLVRDAVADARATLSLNT
jgi:hypothetical protein